MAHLSIAAAAAHVRPLVQLARAGFVLSRSRGPAALVHSGLDRRTRSARSRPLGDRESRFMASAAGEGGAAAATVTAVAENAPPSAEEAAKVLSGLDLRVGRIVKAWKHPEADSLYVEEVELGEPEGPRTICSGLVKFVPEEEMQDRLVVVLANLKPRNMRGIKSNGMLLCASDAAHENVELLIVPEGTAPGERIWFGEEEGGASQDPAATPNQLAKKKIWETVQPLLKTTQDCVASFEGKPMRVSGGIIKSKSLTGANIS